MSIPFINSFRASGLWAALILLVLVSPLAPEDNQPAGAPDNKEAPAADSQNSTVATGNTSDAKQPAKKEEPAARESQPQPAEEKNVSSRFPLIRNLRVEPDSEYPHSVRIRWDVDPANDTAIYVGRYIRPLATRELILEAENLTSPPLGPRSNTYIDRNIPDGAYYYVVVTTYEMSKRNTVVLQPNVNYTTTPSVIFREDRADPDRRPDENENGDEDNGASESALEVSSLFAVNSENGVKLSWRPPTSNNVRFSVYRSESPLDSPDALRSAARLAVVSGRQNIYEDRSPIEGREVYYGVSVTNSASDRENQKLYRNRSFIPHTYRKPQFDNGGDAAETRLDELPDALTAFLAGKDTVRLLWVNPDAGAARGYRIYRSNRPINDAGGLGQAVLAGSVQGDGSGYRDAGLRPGTYYYAILPRDASGREIRAFIEGRTFTGFAVNISGRSGEADDANPNGNDVSGSEDLELTKDQREKLEEPIVEYLQARGGQDQVELNWSIARDDLGSFQTLLFRSDRPMSTLKHIREWGVRAATLPGSRRSYVDRGLEAGGYYYAVVLDFSDHVQETMTVGRNYLAFPVEVGGRPSAEELPGGDAETDDAKFDPSLYELNRVLALTYHKQLYGEAIRRVAPYIRSSKVSSRVRAKALFYTGLSLYHTREYRTSLDYFLTDVVREHYPERSNFWYNRSIKRLR
ncbi:MAG: hypothetical protein NXI24_23990 [bacterium]|nr:hypothetical protein [bacterium]